MGKHKVPYYTPNNLFEYKTPQSEEEKRHDDEEMRILYVAMTRAQDTIIFSISPKKYKRRQTKDVDDITPESIQGLIDRNPEILKELDMDNLDVIEAITEPKEAPEEGKLGLSYSSISRYKECPFSYHLKTDFGFAIDSNEGINYGNIVHNSLEAINKATIEGETLSDKDIILIVSKVHDEYVVDKVDAFKKQETIENVLDYWHTFGKTLKILESEYEFTLYENDYIIALLAHSFSWTFMMMLPVAIYLNFSLDLIFILVFVGNVIAHALIDNWKCNKYEINLIQDQILHILQIIFTFCVCVLNLI